MKIHSSKSGFALITTIVIALFLGIIMSAAFLRANMQLQDNDMRLKSQQAFYAAEIGIQQTVAELRRNPLWRPGNGITPTVNDIVINGSDSKVRGYYSVNVVDATNKYQGMFDSVWVKSTGADDKNKIKRSIKTRIIIEDPAAYFIATAGDLRLGSGANLANAKVLAKDVYFEVDENLPNTSEEEKKLKNIEVEQVFYLHDVINEDNPAVTISPKDGAPKTFQVSSVSLPGVDLDRYKKIAKMPDSKFIEGNYSYNGNIGISTKEVGTFNSIVYATGNIYISGKIKDSMLFVAEGNIYITGNIEQMNDSLNDNEKPQLGLMAKKDVIIADSAPSNLNIEAYIIADGAGTSNGIFTAEGGKRTKGTLNFKGAMALRGEDVRTAVNLNVYQQRVYRYNEALTNNRKIPFIPYISDIVYWEEVSPNFVLNPAEP